MTGSKIAGRVKMFECSKCGECCRNVGKSERYRHLDRGDGVCKKIDDKTNLCRIYGERPIICNVDAFYETYLVKEISKEKYYELNYAACKKLKEEK